MSVLQDFREQHPQYADVDDETLTRSLHQKFYSEANYDEFAAGVNDVLGTSKITLSDRVEQRIQSTDSRLKTLQDDGSSSLDQYSLQDVEELSFFETALRRFGERTTELGGQILSGAGKLADEPAKALGEATGIGGFVFDEGSVLPRYVGNDEYQQLRDEGMPDVTDVAAEGLKGADFGAVPVHTWEEVKRHFDEEGLASGMGEVIAYSAETGIASIPDMVGVIASLPVYVTARSNEIGEVRAQNKGKDKADLIDMMEAVPFALGSALLERFGAKGIAQAGEGMVEAVGKEALKEIVKAGGKAGVREAGTEAVQEGLIEYVGEKWGTDAQMDIKDALERGLAGAVAGGPFGAVAGGVSAGARRVLADTPEGELAKALEAEIEGAEYVTPVEEIAAAKLSPYQAQLTQRIDIEGQEITPPGGATTAPRETITLYRGGNKDGFWWSDDPDYADLYGEGGKQQAQISLDDLNVFDWPANEAEGNVFLLDKSTEEMQKALRDRGYGAVLIEGENKENIYLLAEQIDKAAKSKKKTLSIKPPQNNLDPDVLNMGPGTNYAPMIGKHRELPIDANQHYRLGNGNIVRIPKQPVRRNHIIKRLQRAFGTKIYMGRVKGKTRLGFYRPRIGEIRIKYKNDLEVTAHELAHWIDDRFPWVGNLYARYDKEIRGVSYDDEKDYEGYAEFMRLWLTQEHEARERAPGFYDAFTKELAKDRANDIREPLYDLQEMMHAWFMQGARARMASKIGDPALPIRERIAMATDGVADRMIQETLDRLHAFKVAEQAITAPMTVRDPSTNESVSLPSMGDIDATRSGYKSLRLAMGHSGVTRAVLERGTVNWTEDGNIEFTGKSLKDVFAPVEDRMEDVQLYFVARRAQELAEQNRENLFRSDEIDAGLLIGERDPSIKDAFTEWLAFNDRMMDFYQASGIIGESQREAIQTINKNYVPFNRILESVDNMAAGNKNKVLKSGTPFMRLKGGSGNINDVFDNIVGNTSSMIHMALINKGKQHFYGMIDEANGQTGAMYAVRIPPDVKPVEIDQDQVKRAIIQGMGMSMRDYNVMSEMPKDKAEEMAVALVEEVMDSMAPYVTFFQHGMEPKGNVDSVFRDGKKVYYEIGDPLLYDALAALGPQSHNLAVSILGGFANVLRKGVTLTPTFQVKNFIRDTMNAFTLSRGGIVPAADAGKALIERIYNDEHYWEYIANGGGFSAMAEADGITADRIAADPRSLLDKYDRALSTFEYANRIAEYKSLRKKGYTQREAALMGREISTDFAMRGANQSLRVLTVSIPFLNARMQGLYRIAREVGKRTPEGRFRIDPVQSYHYGLRAMLAITLPSLALYALNKDDERYQEMPEYVKDLSWVFFTGDGEDEYFLVPKPFETGMLFGTLPERAVELMEKRDGKEFSDAMLWMVLETFNVDVVPQAFKPMDDLRKNKNFTGAPIIPEYMKVIEPAEQWRSYTSDAMIALGRKLNISPIKAEYLVRGYFGTLGTWALGLADMVVGDLAQGGETVSRDWEDNILLSPFVDDGPLRRTKSQQDLYDMLKMTRTVLNTTNLMRDRNPERVADYLEGKEKQLLLNSNRILERQATKMREIQNKIDAVTSDPDMPGDEKRTVIHELLRQRNTLTRATMKEINPKKLRAIAAQTP